MNLGQGLKPKLAHNFLEEIYIFVCVWAIYYSSGTGKGYTHQQVNELTHRQEVLITWKSAPSFKP